MRPAVLILLGAAGACAAPAREDISLRGLCAAGHEVAWASGSVGTILRTVDGGGTWLPVAPPPGAETRDFRDVHAFDARRALLMAAGPGAESGVWLTATGGESWEKVLDCPWPEGFFDGIAFWDERAGLLVGDPVAGALLVLHTADGGRLWTRAAALPATIPGEYAFAASGTSVCVQPGGRAWIGTGGAAARVWRSGDFGLTWSAVAAPLAQGAESAGVFSICFADARHGVIVGGDYLQPEAREETAAWTADGGATWTPSAVPPGGFRSCASACGGGVFLCTGPSGTDVSRDGGRTWEPLRDARSAPLPGFHAVDGRFAAGSGGRAATIPRP